MCAQVYGSVFLSTCVANVCFLVLVCILDVFVLCFCYVFVSECMSVFVRVCVCVSIAPHGGPGNVFGWQYVDSEDS